MLSYLELMMYSILMVSPTRRSSSSVDIRDNLLSSFLSVESTKFVSYLLLPFDTILYSLN